MGAANTLKTKAQSEMAEKTSNTSPEENVNSGDEELTREQIWAELDAEESASGEPEERSHIRAYSEDGEELTLDKPDSDDADEDDQNDVDGDQGDDNDDPDDDNAQPDKAEDSEPNIEDLIERNEALEQKLRSSEGRSRGQQRRADRLQKRIDELERRQAAAQAQSEDEDDNLDAIAEEYGDVVGPVVNKVKSLEDRLSKASDSNKAELEAAQEELDDIHEDAWAEYIELRPDGMDLLEKNQEAFIEWIEDQPKRFRDIYARNHEAVVEAEAVAMVVNAFEIALKGSGSDETPSTGGKSETQLSAKRERQKRGAQTSTNTGRQPRNELEEPSANASREEWHAYYDKLDRIEARRKAS